jgi:Flp pilus assembly protein TadD
MRYLSILFCFLFITAPCLAVEDDEAAYYLEKGSLQFREEMYVFAQESLLRALKLNPSSTEAANLLGEIALKNKKRNEAYEYFLLSLSLNEKQDAIHTRAGELADYFGREDEARQHFLRACDLNPKNHIALLGAARSLSLKGDRTGAETYFKQAYALREPASESFIKKAELLYKKKDFNECAAQYAEALKTNPAARDIYFRAMSVDRLRGQPYEALKKAEYLVYLRPHDDEAIIYLARLYYSERIAHNRQKELEIALATAEKALLLKKDNVEYIDFAAEICDALGYTDKAEQYRALSGKAAAKRTTTSP